MAGASSLSWPVHSCLPTCCKETLCRNSFSIVKEIRMQTKNANIIFASPCLVIPALKLVWVNTSIAILEQERRSRTPRLPSLWEWTRFRVLGLRERCALGRGIQGKSKVRIDFWKAKGDALNTAKGCLNCFCFMILFTGGKLQWITPRRLFLYVINKLVLFFSQRAVLSGRGELRFAWRTTCVKFFKNDTLCWCLISECPWIPDCGLHQTAVVPHSSCSFYRMDGFSLNKGISVLQMTVPELTFSTRVGQF